MKVLLTAIFPFNKIPACGESIDPIGSTSPQDVQRYGDWRHSFEFKFNPRYMIHVSLLTYKLHAVRNDIFNSPVSAKYVSLPDISDVCLMFTMHFYDGLHGIVRQMSDVSLPHFADNDSPLTNWGLNDALAPVCEIVRTVTIDHRTMVHRVDHRTTQFAIDRLNL